MTIAQSIARAEALPAPVAKKVTVICKNLVIDLDKKQATCEGSVIHLTGKEYQMLEFLAINKDEVVSKEMILNHLYGGMDEPEIKIIDVFMCKLRRKLTQASKGKSYIETAWGRGYVLKENALGPSEVS